MVGRLENPCFLRKARGTRSHSRLYGRLTHVECEIPYREAVTSYSPGLRSYPGATVRTPTSTTPAGLRHSRSGQPQTWRSSNSMSCRSSSVCSPDNGWRSFVEETICAKTPNESGHVVLGPWWRNPFRVRPGFCWCPVPGVASQPRAIGRYRFAVLMPLPRHFSRGESCLARSVGLLRPSSGYAALSAAPLSQHLVLTPVTSRRPSSHTRRGWGRGG